MRIKTFISAIVLAAGAFSASAAPVMLNAKLDSASMLMGNVNTLRLEVVQDKGVKGNFPLFEKFGPEGIVTLLNDTIELSRPTKVDTLEVGSGRIQINYEVPVQVFDSGLYKLPEFEYAAGRDTARSKSLLLTVVPVNVTADDPISPMTDVADPENPSIFDSLPDWLYYYWWIILLGIALICGGIYAWRKFRTEGTLLPRKPQLSPYDQAMLDLKSLKSRKLWEAGREKEYYTELTDILRRYLDGRFGIKAMEMTSNEIMSHLADLGSGVVPRDKMRDILDMADFVKFAMVRPLPDDNVALFKNAEDFVESTKPVETAESGSDNQTPAVSADTSNDTGVGLGKRGRAARHDDSAGKISGTRMKVGKNNRKGKEVRK